jgi:VWFA-related protein
VTIPVRVTDRKGKPVANLSKEDFALMDHGRTVQVDYFAEGTQRVALIYGLDASGSARDIIIQQRETALALFNRFGRSSRLAVIHFREQPILVLPLAVQSPAQIRAAFRLAALPNRRTAIFDAALFAVRAFDSSPRPLDNQTERRIIILLTDGLDNASSERYQKVIAEAQAREISFYVINLALFVPGDGKLVARIPTRGVRELAERTGGRFFVVGDAASALNPRAEYNLRPIFEAIAEDLQSQYILGFYAGGNSKTQIETSMPEVTLISPRTKRYRVRRLAPKT